MAVDVTNQLQHLKLVLVSTLAVQIIIISSSSGRGKWV